ncbi:uncharacterized protein A1O5_08434 [Cladophialophora psammophila CBS 110553]|uniref:Uncharacterized protein n=1 Tax=Cladophialophora psammophila CBS 110553 TaxID=1182543 RepID=W9WUB9_9EURO|nr:uncharacterized protein A1O5_08434 [Cladophialophora psammophila CBS 110553]EXJ68640.1 hypothetical protein A1O5_08434 [Cladophialophora psammophila CBS 110553]
MGGPYLFTAIVTLLSVLGLHSAVAQNSCGTDQNPYCAGDSTFEQICCPYPNVCYWQNRNGEPGCCPAGQVCDGSSYYPPTPQPTPTLQTTTLHPSTITITPTPASPPSTTVVTGGGIIIITTVPNSGVTVITTPNSVVTITTIYGGPCGGGVCSTVTSGVGGVYSTFTSVVSGAFSTVTSGVASAYSTVSGVLVGSSGVPRSSPISTFAHFMATLFVLVGNLLG